MNDLEPRRSPTRFLDLPDQIESVYGIVRELRPHLSLDDFKHLVMLGHAADGYRIVVHEERGAAVAMMGYRILHDLAHGSHLCIDDLIVSAGARSRGHGSELLKFAEAECRRLGFASLRVNADTGATDAESVGAFFEREGWDLRETVFKKKVPSH